MEAEGKGWDPVKLAEIPRPTPSLHPVINYWPFQGGIFIVVIFVKCYQCFQMFFF